MQDDARRERRQVILSMIQMIFSTIGLAMRNRILALLAMKVVGAIDNLLDSSERSKVSETNLRHSEILVPINSSLIFGE